MSRILISGYYGYKNIGDEAILKSIVSFLRLHASDPDITVLTSDVDGAGSRFGIRGVDRNSILKVAREIRKCDCLISGGGSLLQDVTSRRSIAYYFAILLMARIFGKDTIIYCQGIGPIEKKINRVITGWLLKKARYITVRDGQSESELQSLGIKAEKINVSADPVLAFPRTGNSKPSGIMSLIENAGGKPVVGVSLKKSRGSKGVQALSADLNRLHSELDASFIFLPFHHLEDMETYDEMEELLDFKPIMVREKYEVEEILQLMESMSLFIGVRLHSLILASVAELPFVALTYDPKIDHFLESMKMDKPLLYENLREGQLYEEAMAVWENREKHKEAIRNGRVENIKRLEYNNELIGKIIDERE